MNNINTIAEGNLLACVAVYLFYKRTACTVHLDTAVVCTGNDNAVAVYFISKYVDLIIFYMI